VIKKESGHQTGRVDLEEKMPDDLTGYLAFGYPSRDGGI
jgi:hypothetical protein